LHFQPVIELLLNRYKIKFKNHFKNFFYFFLLDKNNKNLKKNRYTLNSILRRNFFRLLLPLKVQPLRVMHIVSGYDVPHVHLHLLPSFKRGDTEASLLAGRSGIRADEATLREIQEKLAFSPALAAIIEERLERLSSAKRIKV